MKMVPIEEARQDLSGILQQANESHEEVVVEGRDGPLGVLMGISDYVTLLAMIDGEEDLMSNPEFLRRIEKTDKELEEGKVWTLAEARARYAAGK